MIIAGLDEPLKRRLFSVIPNFVRQGKRLGACLDKWLEEHVPSFLPIPSASIWINLK